MLKNIIMDFSSQSNNEKFSQFYMKLYITPRKHHIFVIINCACSDGI